MFRIAGEDDIKKMKFAVFGLGNRTYDKFNEMAKVERHALLPIELDAPI